MRWILWPAVHPTNQKKHQVNFKSNIVTESSHSLFSGGKAKNKVLFICGMTQKYGSGI